MAFAVDPAAGRLTKLNAQPVSDKGTCHISVDKTGKAVGEQDLTLDMTVRQVREALSKAPAIGVGTGGPPRRGAEHTSAAQPLWPYTWGRVFRHLRWPVSRRSWAGDFFRRTRILP